MPTDSIALALPPEYLPGDQVGNLSHFIVTCAHRLVLKSVPECLWFWLCLVCCSIYDQERDHVGPDRWGGVAFVCLQASQKQGSSEQWSGEVAKRIWVSLSRYFAPVQNGIACVVPTRSEPLLTTSLGLTDLPGRQLLKSTWFELVGVETLQSKSGPNGRKLDPHYPHPVLLAHFVDHGGVCWSTSWKIYEVCWRNKHRWSIRSCQYRTAPKHM